MTYPSAVLQRTLLLDPAQIPRQDALLQWSAESPILWAAPESFSEKPTSSGEMSTLVRGILQTPRLRVDWIVSPSGQAEDVVHDDYFHITRVRGCAPAIFARMALAARLCLLEDVREAPVTVARSLLAEVDCGLARLVESVGGVGPATQCVSRWEMDGAEPRPGWAMRRWIRGHQVFAALSQGLIYSFQEMGETIRAGGDHVAVRRWAELSISLLAGSGAALVFTGDFPVEDYMTVVRPSMMPPAAPICLSGLMSIDHRVLTQAMRDLRPTLRALHELEQDLHKRLQHEMAKVYDRHIHVCERFVGERPSLLTAHTGKKSGPSLIEQFKTLRMKAFEVPAHTPRLGPSRPAFPEEAAQEPAYAPASGDAVAPAEE